MLVKSKKATKTRKSEPAWIPCPGGCGEFWCTIHRTHVFECECPAIEEWKCDPYAPKDKMPQRAKL